MLAQEETSDIRSGSGPLEALVISGTRVSMILSTALLALMVLSRIFTHVPIGNFGNLERLLFVVLVTWSGFSILGRGSLVWFPGAGFLLLPGLGMLWIHDTFDSSMLLMPIGLIAVFLSCYYLL